MEEQNMDWDAFLSHTWANGTHAKVVAIARRLAEKGFRYWLDEEHTMENLDTATVRGINGSWVFLAFITNEYLEASNKINTNAGKEFNFATELGVQYIIPIVLDPALLNQAAWQHSQVLFHLQNTLYIDFSTPGMVDQNMDVLLQRIGALKQLKMNS